MKSVSISSTKWPIILILSTIVAFLLFHVLSKEEIDPLWTETLAYVEQPQLQLGDAKDSLLDRSYKIHAKPILDPIGLLSEPFMPIMSWRKYSLYLDRLIRTKKLFLSGVNGSGMTTTAEALAKFVAGEDGEIIQLPFSPQFDLINHERFIGSGQANGDWKDGELITFLKKAQREPTKHFILMLDDVDKGSIETFFGPYIWRHLGDPKYTVKLGDWIFNMPENFYLIALSHYGASNSHQLTNEHFTRFGGLSRITPTPEELSVYLSNQQDKDPRIKDRDFRHRAVYRFAKANAIVEEQFGLDFTLGQWSDLRKAYQPEVAYQFNRTFLNHISGLGPRQGVREDVFDPLYYALENDGLAFGSSPWARQLAVLKDWGIASELIVAAIFTLLTAIGSLYFLKRRKRRLHERITAVQNVFYRLEAGEYSFEEAQVELDTIKSTVDSLVLASDLNYTEANFFYNLLTDKLTQIRSRREVASHFSHMVETFVEDGHLSKAEELKLRRYLDRVKANISKADYDRLANEIELNSALFQNR